MSWLVFGLFGNDGCGEDTTNTSPLPGNYSRLNIVSDSFLRAKTFFKKLIFQNVTCNLNRNEMW